MLRVGIDVVEVARVERLVRRFDRDRLSRLFTQQELEYACTSTRLCAQRLAVRLAAKEAFIKAWGSPLPLNKIEVIKEQGTPCLSYEGKLYPLSLSHSEDHAVAVVVWQATDSDSP